MSIEVEVPVLGESVSEATAGRWLKQPGEAVALDEPIASLETDKVAVEVPSPVAGIIGARVAAEGDTVAVGALLGLIETSGVAASPRPCPGCGCGSGCCGGEADDAGGAFACRAPRGAGATGIDPATVKGTGARTGA
jgi:2-oxoglutarate dehydrogenase E2 component (dihydrolipoamide succinyltransferase)